MRILILIFSTFIILLGSIIIQADPVKADTYSNFNTLKNHNTAKIDYNIISRDTGSSTAVIAIHGGNIERGTDQIANAVANQGGFDFYTFSGLKTNSASLHITSTHFDEPTGCQLIAKATVTLSIHGCYGTNQALTNLGGADKVLGQKVKTALQSRGFKVVNAPSNLAGRIHSNICNRNLTNKGVQLELSVPLRNKLDNNPDLFNSYVEALVTALQP